MRYLLDTHVFLWLLGEPERLPQQVRDALADRRNEILVSAVSALEVATKVRIGKLDAARPLVDAWSERVREIDGEDLPVSTAHALHAGSMAWEHRDPFDRLLVAQALIENVALVSADAALAGVTGLRRLAF